MNKRRYRMVARADAAEQTRRSILDAAAALFAERDPTDITLETIAARAGVTLQTVLRRFGSKDAVFAAAAAQKGAEIAASREPERPGDRGDAVRTLVASYEEMGHINWRLLRFEEQEGALHQVLVEARANHRAWVARVFADLLPRRGAERERRIDALFAATDLYLWKLLRLDLGRTRAETEATLILLVEALAQKLGKEKHV